MTSGTKLKYGTVLTATVNSPVEGFQLRVNGEEIASGSTFVVNKEMNVKYVDPVVIEKITAMAAAFSNDYAGKFGPYTYNEGTASATWTYPSGSVYVRNVNFYYYDDVSAATAAYNTLKTSKIDALSGYTSVDASELTADFDNVELHFKAASWSDTKGYATHMISFLAIKGNYVIDGCTTTQYFVSTDKDNSIDKTDAIKFANSAYFGFVDKTLAKSAAAAFAAAYTDHAFGTYVDQGDGTAKAVVGGSSQRFITFSVVSDPASKLAAFVSGIDPEKAGTQITGVTGFDGYHAYYRDIKMKGDTTMLYIGGYVGNVYVDCYTSAAYFKGGNASADQKTALINAIVSALNEVNS